MSSFLFSLPGTRVVFQLSQSAKENKTLSLGILLGFAVLYAAHYVTSPYRKLPPGPRGYPIIGNVLELRSQQWLKFTEWRKQFGQWLILIFLPPILNFYRSRRCHLSQRCWSAYGHSQLSESRCRSP
jgi:hypothetical protein